MAATTASERGGGNGATGEMRAKILHSINNWAEGAQWADPDRADRVFQKMNEAPEKFITPNPETCGSYREEASRIYEKIKREHGLRLESELAGERRDYEQQADAHLRTEIREIIEAFGVESVRAVLDGETDRVCGECYDRVSAILEYESPDVFHPELEHYESLDPESGEMPDADEETDPDPEPESDGETVTDPDPEPEPEPEAETADDRGVGSDETGDRTAAETTSTAARSRWIARAAGRVLGRGVVRFVQLALAVLAWLAPRAASAGKSGAYWGGRILATTLRLLVRGAWWSVKTAAVVIAAFLAGLAAGVTAEGV